MTDEQELALFRCGTANLQKHAKRKDYMKAVWVRKSGVHKGREYYISKRTRQGMWIKWQPYTGSEMRGLSLQITSLLDFFNRYMVVD